MAILQLQGFITDIRYSPRLTRTLPVYELETCDINAVKGFGLMRLSDRNDTLAFSKWVSPKRTRSYPFARIYNTYGQNSKCVTVIPIIKDEGLLGDNDRINAITFSWMSLLNVCVILAWYDMASASRLAGKITKQRFDTEYVRAKLQEISAYRASALHWNTSHFKRDFVDVYQRAIASYQQISTRSSIAMHNANDHLRVLQQFLDDGAFSVERFKTATLTGSAAAARRESVVAHPREYLLDGDKAIFRVQNYLGGEYHLTADEIYYEGDTLVIQESKNSGRDKLPKLSDVQDGLFKLILFVNLNKLLIDEKPVSFRTQLKLTGNLISSIRLPADPEEIEQFFEVNALKPSERMLVGKLEEEARYNPGLSILISGRA